jgi:hypothetical protein
MSNSSYESKFVVSPGDVTDGLIGGSTFRK